MNATVHNTQLVDYEGGHIAPRGSPRTESISRRTFFRAGVAGAIGLTAIGGATFLVSTSEPDDKCQNGSVIAPPLGGEWMVMNPPGHPEFADDFIGMKAGHSLPYPMSSIPRHAVNRIPISRTFGWGRPVYAPIDGTVLAVSNYEPDNEELNVFRDTLDTLVSPPDVMEGHIQAAAGNHVVIEGKEGVAFLAHLRRGSIVVAEGMEVGAGQLLGEVGNSGASVFPHLHLQLMSEWTTDLRKVEKMLIPYRFSQYERRISNRVRRHSWESVHQCVPAQRTRFRVR